MGRHPGSAIRDNWQRRYDKPYATTSGNERLGAIPYERLQEVAAHLDRLSDFTRAQARFVRRVASAVHEYGVRCADELPAEVRMRLVADE